MGVKKISEIPKKVTQEPKVNLFTTRIRVDSGDSQRFIHSAATRGIPKGKCCPNHPKKECDVKFIDLSDPVRDKTMKNNRGPTLLRRSRRKCGPCPIHKMSQLLFSDDDLQCYQAFASAIICGEAMPKSFGYPSRYLNYCVKNQHNPDLSKQFPFPPGAPVHSIMLNGRETLVVIPQAASTGSSHEQPHAPSTVSGGREYSGGRNSDRKKHP